MRTKKPIEFKVIRKNQYGHRFILEPKERIQFRKKCKYNKLSFCEKGYYCYIQGACLHGCSPDVNCPRLWAWDKRNGLERPYTMVENEYPNLKPTTFTWHPATQSPGLRRVVVAFRGKGHENEYMILKVVKFGSMHVAPATVNFKHEDGTKILAVAWAYYNEFIKGVAPWMITNAEHAAWAWWPDKDEKNNKSNG